MSLLSRILRTSHAARKRPAGRPLRPTLEMLEDRWLPSTLSGFVYNDINNNGSLDSGEAGIVGATVNLTGTNSQGKPVSMSAKTDASGAYSFTNLAAGTYTLKDPPPGGYVAGSASAGTQGGTATGSVLSGIVIDGSTTGTDNDFGELSQANGWTAISCNFNPTAIPAGSTLWFNSVFTVTGLGSAPANLHFTNQTISFTVNGTPTTYSLPNSAVSISSQSQGNTDVSGRPLFPSLFVTDITNAPDAQSGDWQYGGTPITPSAVFGTWKTFSETITLTTATPTVALTASADPAGNGWNLGPGADAPPAGLPNQGYGAEIRWSLSSLGLQPGHQYRFYVMVHDGDQNKSGGDAGQAVYTKSIPGQPPPASVSGFVMDNTGAAMGGVPITLTGTTSTGQSITLTTTTAADGSYSFAGLLPGTYQVSETPPTPYTESGASVGTVNGAPDGATVGGGPITNIVLASGNDGVNYDFTNVIPVG
jgi:hypothetical protein